MVIEQDAGDHAEVRPDPAGFRQDRVPVDPEPEGPADLSNTQYFWRLNAKQQPIALVSKPVSILKTPKFKK